MKDTLKRVAAQLPGRWQTLMKRVYFGRQIMKGTFRTAEPEFDLLPELLKPGDWAIDVGANIGQYTKRMSDLVGAGGRVIAFEPVPETFAVLTGNVSLFQHANVTLVNAAASDRCGLVSMAIPRQPGRLASNYEAHVSSDADASIHVMALAVDTLAQPVPCHRISLIKIDVEGHEAFALSGMAELLRRDRPVLIVETGSTEVAARLASLGYTAERLPASPNLVCRPGA